LVSQGAEKEPPKPTSVVQVQDNQSIRNEIQRAIDPCKERRLWEKDFRACFRSIAKLWRVIAKSVGVLRKPVGGLLSGSPDGPRESEITLNRSTRPWILTARPGLLDSQLAI